MGLSLREVRRRIATCYRFLAGRIEGEMFPDQMRLILVQNFFELLKERVPN